MRDLNADLALCEAATSGPWGLHDAGLGRGYVYASIGGVLMMVSESGRIADARLIATAREGWPEAIRRAIASERENAELRDQLMTVFQKARNDVARWDGGQCVGLPVFQDRVYARRLVKDLQPILFPYQNK
ncbi:hypothetical protein MJ749_15040 [Paenibacillus polymyxa]|uniref:hypothetical protein n=1 Tax=Paenibacillus polymyxa TaxID=1406 RepID=UPI001F110CCD|nr:hypothetical protein [Paenibacillus polymyxa]UMR34010.1 hypothetical protein MJ749_15040 [Paenibacillus polymyxa]